MERLTHEADFGLEDWEETIFFVKSDPNGAYNIIDIAKYQGEPEFDEILKNVALRLAAIEDILGDEYDLDELKEMVQANIPRLIDEQSTISAVPVVRCRECENYDENGDCISLDLRIGIHSDTINYDFCPDPDFYCAYGRRKIETVLPKSDAKDESLEGDQ